MLAEGLDEFFTLPEATPGTNPSWFGFLLTLRSGQKISRKEITEQLENKKVGTRLLFAGNLTKQPAFSRTQFRISGSLKNTDKIMENSFWMGVWPGLSDSHLDYMVSSLKSIMLRKG